MVFWWTGRGYLALLTVIGVFGLFGALLTLILGNEPLDRMPWMWGIGLVLSAVINWVVGSRLNRRSLSPLPHTIAGNPMKSLQGRYFYRGRHRFCSLPMETWSVVALVFGVALIVRGVVVQLG